MLIANSKAFDFWRNNANSLSKGLRISVSLRKNAKELLDNCFDYFKDIQQVEYKNIYNFVESTTKFDDISYSHEECIQSIYEHFLVKKSSKLEKHMIAFAVIAAYVETRNIND
jgi:pantothenate kinase